MALQLLEECKTWATPNTISYSAAISARLKRQTSLLALNFLVEFTTRAKSSTISYCAASTAS